MALLTTITTKKYTKFKQNIGITEEALTLGEVVSLGYCLLINRDPTNFVEVRTSTGSVKFARLNANGGMALLRFGSGVSAPFVIADTAPCQIEVFLLSV